MIDLTGKVFGLWVVLSFSHKNKHGMGYWKCQCGCGNDGVVSGGSLTNGSSKSCGCVRNQDAKARLTTHGMYGTSTHRTWRSMIERCYNLNHSSYYNYGGRGIKVCHRWRNSFSAFLVDMGEKPEGMTIERKDNDKGYSPDNCKWATQLEQARNKRNNKFITYQDETKTIAEWSEISGINYSTLIRRFDKGWPADKILRNRDYRK